MKNLFGLIVDNKCIALKEWGPMAFSLTGQATPTFYDFDLAAKWQYDDFARAKNNHSIKPVTVTWENDDDN
jgi:hypothetical protein